MQNRIRARQYGGGKIGLIARSLRDFDGEEMSIGGFWRNLRTQKSRKDKL